MKKLAQINVVCNGSTGKIMGDIQRLAIKKGYSTISFYGRKKGFKDLNCKKIGSNFSVVLHAFFTYAFNRHGHASYFATKKLVKHLKEYNPNIIHLHNIHGYYLNYKVLFKYLKYEYRGKVIWTLHDCWSFTGHCAYFDYVKCERWKTECYNCPQKKSYPFSWFFDTSRKEYNTKKKYFTNICNLTLITPSKWLSKQISESYLNRYKTIVINNGIDLQIFKKSNNSSIRKKYNIPKNKKIILGVANIWEERKGLNVFIELSKMVGYNTIIVLVGLTPKQIKLLPKNIVGIKRTDNVKDLVSIYSIADLFVNPTREDNYPTTNIEAIACQTPIITYDTGGCKEQVYKNTGYCCKKNTATELYKIINLCLNKNYKKNVFSNKDILNNLDCSKKYDEYLKLYEEKEDL